MGGPGATVDLRGLRVEYERRGSGPTLIWGHGLTSSRADEATPPILIDWDRVAGGVEVVRYDAVGHGHSATAEDLDRYRWVQLARDQSDLAAHLDLGPCVIGGASMGAATALHRVLLAPHLVRGLVLVIPPTAWDTRAAQADGYRTMADLIEAGSLDRVVAAGRQLPPPDPFVDVPGWHDRSAARLQAFESARLAGLFRGAAAADLPPVDAITAIDVPTLILAWTGDAGHPVETAERLADAIDSSELHLASTRPEVETWTDRLIDFMGAAPT